MRFTLKRRDFSDLVVQPGVTCEILRYSHDVLGGPAQATIKATGTREQLFELVNHLRAPVEILNDQGEAVWWGYLATLDITWGVLKFGADVEKMSNRVAVAYTIANERYTTQWSQDDDSVGEYGIKEMLLSHSDCTDADALSERDTFLAGAKYPIPTIKFGSESVGFATLTCRGWYSTLDWQYYANDLGQEAYETVGQGGREVGEDDRPILAMSFELESATAWTATILWLRGWYKGSQPSDSLNVSIRNSSGGLPGATIYATASLAGSEFSSGAEWLEFPLSTGVLLQPGTQYWIYVARSGAVNEDSFYMLDTNTNNGYPRGILQIYNTNLGAWQTNSWSKGDLLFKLIGTISVTSQMQALTATAGQFFEGSIIEDASTIETVPYRSGDSTGLYELEKLLVIGTDNDRRYLAEATRGMYLRIYEEPAKPSSPSGAYGLDAEGNLYFPGTRNPVSAELCPVGMWCTLIDVIPATVNLDVIANPAMFFIEAAEFDVARGQYQIQRTKNQTNTYDVGGVEQG